MGHPVLRRRSEEVAVDEIATSTTQRLLDDLLDTMRDLGGVGIAAPQVGVDLRIFVIEVGPNSPRHTPQNQVPVTFHVNPLLECHGEAGVRSGEGCLSVPGLRGVVRRYDRVTLRSLGRDGLPQTLRWSGLPAIIAQHEIDHLNGQLYLDRLWSPAALAFNEEGGRFGTLAPDFLDSLDGADPRA